jgi:hypothetical protein
MFEAESDAIEETGSVGTVDRSMVESHGHQSDRVNRD